MLCAELVLLTGHLHRNMYGSTLQSKIFRACWKCFNMSTSLIYTARFCLAQRNPHGWQVPWNWALQCAPQVGYIFHFRTCLLLCSQIHQFIFITLTIYSKYVLLLSQSVQLPVGLWVSKNSVLLFLDIVNSRSWVQLDPLALRLAYCIESWWLMSMGHLWIDNLQGKTKLPRKYPILVPLCSPKITRGFPWN
jgi:hypothetical protein